MSNYEPSPIDTSGIDLDDKLQRLVEELAESNHDHWALQRFADGWTYGPHRDDQHKKHPGLVAYEQLSETEKEYDRISVTTTIKAILSLGFQISRTEQPDGVTSEKSV